MKKFLYLLLLLIALSGCIQTQTEGVKMVDKKALFVIAPENFRDEEFAIPKEILENSGVEVTVASKEKGIAKGMLGMEVEVDKVVYELNPKDFDIIVFVGGTGAATYFNDEKILNFVKEAYEEGKIIGAICIAPSILANAGILEGKKATAWPSERDNIESKGGIYTGSGVEVDGNVITANGPKSAEEFGRKILEALRK